MPIALISMLLSDTFLLGRPTFRPAPRQAFHLLTLRFRLGLDLEAARRAMIFPIFAAAFSAMGSPLQYFTGLGAFGQIYAY